MASVSDVVSVILSIRDRGLSRQGFNTQAIAFRSDVPSWRVKRVTALSDVVALGFGIWTPLYTEARDAFNQDPGVEQLVIVRMGASEEPATGLDLCDAVDSDWFGLTSTERDATTVAKIAAWTESRSKPAIFVGQTADSATLLGGASVIKTVADAGYNSTAIIYHNPAVQSGKLTISAAFVASNVVNMKVNGVALAEQTWATTSDALLASIAAALQALDSIATATVTADSSGTENDREIVWVAADNKANVVISNYVCSAGASINTATVELIGGGGAEAAAAAWMSSRLAFDPGQTTWKFGELVGITPDALGASDIAALKLYKANFYTSYGSAKLPAEGTMASGRFIDVQIGAFWLKINMQADVFDLMQTMAPKKVPYTDPGAQQIGAIVRKRMALAVGAQILADDPKYTVTVPKVANQDPGNKAVRKMAGILFSGTLAGAVHGVALQGELTF
jgi:hypothetical protein